MPVQALDINMPDLVAMLGVLACAAAAGWIGLRIAALFRKGQLSSLPDLLAATAVLIVLAAMFFNHQRVRRLDYEPGPSLVDQADSVEPASIECLRNQAELQRLEAQRRREEQEAAQRDRELRERERLLDALTGADAQNQEPSTKN